MTLISTMQDTNEIDKEILLSTKEVFKSKTNRIALVPICKETYYIKLAKGLLPRLSMRIGNRDYWTIDKAKELAEIVKSGAANG
jgi:hypothetical protein